METRTVDVTTPDGTADAYLAEGGGPGVLFVMDAIGLRPRIAEMAERIAAAGYTVLAPNVFYRAGRAPVLALPDFSDAENREAFMKEVRPLIGALDKAAVESDGRAYLDFLAGVAPGPVGITGYCMGARAAFRIAAAFPDRVAAMGGFHGGRLVTEEDDSPHRSAGQVRAEVYFGHADQDQSMTPEQQATLDQALSDGGVEATSELYEGALHGYTMADTAVYDEAATERHFDALLGLFARRLG